MSETKQKNEIRDRYKAAGVVFRHEDQFMAGCPDLSITCAGYTTWIEVKTIERKNMPAEFNLHDAMKKYKNAAIQIETLKRLTAAGGRAFLIVFFRTHTGTSLLALSGDEASHLFRSGCSILLTEGKSYTTDPFELLDKICLQGELE